MGAARKFSPCDVYHVTSRGVGGQIIFEDDEDRRHFLCTLKDACTSYSVKVGAWCLMDNHFHLLLNAPLEDVSLAMKHLKGIYARDYNARYDRSGHLFQAVFGSFPIADESYYAAAVRYIHNNPVRAGIVSSACDYPWSSYQEYLGKSYLLDASLMLDLGSINSESLDYEDEPGRGPHFMYRGSRLSDDKALAVAKEALGVASPSAVSGYGRNKRDESVRLLRACGLSKAQISRLTGVSETTVRRILT